jgi:galactitol-specific phosphotransferase system IIB component
VIFSRVNSEEVGEMQGQDEAIDMVVTSSHLLEVVFLILRLQTHFTRT